MRWRIPDLTAEAVAGRRGADGRARAVPRHHRPHLARHSVLSRVPEERGARGHRRHQQSVLVERRRQVLQLRARDAARRGDSADGPAAAQDSIRRTPRDKSMRNMEYPLKWDDVFAYVGFPAFLKPFDGGGWRDVYQVRIARGILCGVRQDRHAVHDAAARRELPRILPLLRHRSGRDVHIMPYDPRRPMPSATSRTRRRTIRRCSIACAATRSRSAARSATT